MKTWICPNNCDLTKPGQFILCDSMDHGPYFCPYCKENLMKEKQLYEYYLFFSGRDVSVIADDHFEDSTKIELYVLGKPAGTFGKSLMYGWSRAELVKTASM